MILLGTDPILSVLIAPVWKLFHPATKIVQWSFDLYPEAAYADGIMDRDTSLAHLLTWLVRWAYRACDVVVDIGACMRQLLLQHDSTMQVTTLVPWALFEPDHPVAAPTHERAEMFGDTRLALLYSGSFGRAHEYESMLELMRHLRDSPTRLALSVKGNREHALRAAVLPEDTNVRFVPPVAASGLEQRLASADIPFCQSSQRVDWRGRTVQVLRCAGDWTARDLLRKSRLVPCTMD